MTSNIFIYDFLMKDVENTDFGLTNFKTVGCLYNFDRFGYNFIIKSERPGSSVVGDIFEIDDKQRETIDKFYRKFGYNKENVPVLDLVEQELVDCIVYYLKEEDKDMISEEEMKVFGSAKPFKFMKECYDMIENDFRKLYKKDNSEIHHIYTTHPDGFLEELNSVKKDNPGKRIKVAGLVIVTKE